MLDIAHIFETEDDMIAPININLPNGLILTMYANPKKRIGLRVTDPGESEAQLWRRFVSALKSTDFDAIVKLYTSAVVQAERYDPITKPPVPKNAMAVGSVNAAVKKPLAPLALGEDKILPHLTK